MSEEAEEEEDTQSFYSSFYSLAPSSDEAGAAMHESADWSAAALRAHLHVRPPSPPPAAPTHAQTATLETGVRGRRQAEEQAAASVHERSSGEEAKEAEVVLQRHPAGFDAQELHSTRPRLQPHSTLSTTPRPSVSTGESLFSRQHAIVEGGTSAPARTIPTNSPRDNQQHVLPVIASDAHGWRMSRAGEERGEDLFLELANDRAAVEHARPISHGEPLQRRISSVANPPSLSAERRPRSSGNALGQGGASMLDKSKHLQRHVARHSTPSASPSPWIDEDGASISSKSRSGVSRRPEMSSERLPSRLNNHARPADLPQFGRGRHSFGSSPQTLLAQPSQLSHNWPDSFQYPTGNSEPKPSNHDSTSVDSETAETVWDELDDLKSRIKKLELTGKLPSTSGAAALAVEHNDRPRTATTAPTTIDSSPKHDKSEPQQQMPESRSRSIAQEMSGEYAVGGPGAANIHPNLHAALAKAKPLLSPTLFRTLEATAADALQLAAMTGSAGPQGTAMTAASIINGVTVSDRHVRRKADTMCRNLTDLVLALCEGRSEAPSLVSSPTPSTKQSPSLRYSRSSLGPTDGISRAAARPMSRLEARRSSILGSQGGNSSSLAGSPLEASGDASLSEHESTASYPRLQRPDPTQSGRAASRLQAARERHFGSGAAGDDEDPTIRPPSRAATDAGRSARSFLRRDYNTPSRSPSFRDSLAARRTSQDYFSRVPSDSSADLARRQALDTFNTLVVPEESDAGDRRSVSRATSRTNRRVTSYIPHSSRRSGGAISGEGPSLHRATSLQQRRHVLVE